MHLTQVAIFVFLYLDYCHCASKVWLYKNCGKNGFTCISKNRKTTIIYQCPSKNKDYQFFVNEFNGPASTESVIIKNCQSLTVYFRCTTFKTERKNLKYLQISNIHTLRIERSPAYHSQLPPTVLLENITLIKSIPSFSFSQIRVQNKRCILPKSDFHSISLRNVTVDTIHTEAFHMPNAFGNVAFIDSRINNFHTSSMLVNHDRNSSFSVSGSRIGMLHPSAIRIAGKNVIFSETNFEKILSGGIIVASESFYFMHNSVSTLLPYALSVFSVDTFILKNRFGSMKAKALEKIGPRMSGNLGNGTTYGYDFTDNQVDSTEADSLHPNTVAYDRVSSSVSFRRNSLPCTCGKADWLISTVDNGQGVPKRNAFYLMVFNKDFENICSSSCNLPIETAKPILQENPCPQNSTIETLCRNPQLMTTISTDDTSKGYSTHSTTTEHSIPVKTEASTKRFLRTRPTTESFNTFTTPTTSKNNQLTGSPISRSTPLEYIETFTSPSTTNGASSIKYMPTSSTIRETISHSTPLEYIGRFTSPSTTTGASSIKYMPTSSTIRETMSPRSTILYRDNINMSVSSSKKLEVITARAPFEESITKINIVAPETNLELKSSSYKQACSVYLSFMFCLVYYIL